MQKNQVAGVPQIGELEIVGVLENTRNVWEIPQMINEFQGRKHTRLPL